MDRIVGTKAPEFSLTACEGDGSAFRNVKLSDYKDKWLVLFFYPLNFTDIWPTEITGFSERKKEFEEQGAEILAVSVDSEYSHQTWINGSLGKINFPLASDLTKQVSSDYGVLLEGEGIALRGLFIIDPDSIIKYSVLQDNDIGRSVDETLRVLRALKTGGLCPLDWDIGEDLL